MIYVYYTDVCCIYVLIEMSIEIAIIGATGNVGRNLLSMMVSDKNFPAYDVRLYASSRSANSTIIIDDMRFKVLDMNEINFADYQICVFNTEAEVSERYIPLALSQGAYVVDSSSKYRLHRDVPLIIPPVNLHDVTIRNKLYAHANCLSSPIATTIAPMHQNNRITRMSVTTYQSTSGAGKVAMDECLSETSALIHDKPYHRTAFPKQIAFNVIPQVGTFLEDGMTTEEYKIIYEIKKVVDEKIAVNATAVRVPVIIGHSISLNLEFAESCSVKQIESILSASPFISVHKDFYMTPVEVVGSDMVHVSRIRRDPSVRNGLQLWICSDNLRRGAATDSFEILRAITKLLS